MTRSFKLFDSYIITFKDTNIIGGDIVTAKNFVYYIKIKLKYKLCN